MIGSMHALNGKCMSSCAVMSRELMSPGPVSGADSRTSSSVPACSSSPVVESLSSCAVVSRKPMSPGPVSGADSRTSTGSYVANRVSDKLTEIGDRIYCCRSGSAADTQAVSDVVRYHLASHSVALGEKARPRVVTCASLFRKML